jgi:signal transduction histidine kinase
LKKRDPGRVQALKVAGSATALGTLVFVIIVLVLNVLLIGHLKSQVDARLEQRLALSSRILSDNDSPSAVALESTSEDHDDDDVPIFLWKTNAEGKSASVNGASPTLPTFPRTPGPHTASIGNSSYRFDVIKFKSGALIDGETLSNVLRVQNSLYVVELIVGLVLIVLMLVAAYVVGIRALAPISLARQRQSAFIADASHELRTPISVLEAEVHVALSRERDPGSYRATLERVRHEGERLERIVEELLWLARTEGDPVQPGELERTDITSVVRNSCNRFRVVAASRGSTLEFETLPETTIFIIASDELLDKLVSILLDNACKFAGEVGLIEVSLFMASGYVTLRVDDNGPGIAEEARAKVFERFHHSLSPLGGTGLGLAIADSIITTTRARCTVSTSDLGGARFDVVWPVEK